MKRPPQITITGYLFVLAGLSAVFTSTYQLLYGKLNVNFAVLMLPVGIGLLKGQSSSLFWAKFWLGIFSLLFASLLVFYPFLNDSHSAKWFGKELVGLSRHFMMLGPLLLCLLVAGWFWRTLSSPSTQLFFSQNKNQISKR